MATPAELRLKHGTLSFPQFLPDATFGQVRGLDALATAACGVKAVMMNTFHLMQKPGSGESTRLDCASGFGAATFVTGSFGFVAASRVLARLTRRATDDAPAP